MLKSITKKFLSTLGLQITRIPKQQTICQSSLEEPNRFDSVAYVETLAKDPLNADLHLQFAMETSKMENPYLAYAELKTAEYLGADREKVSQTLGSFRQALPNPKSMNHNQYYRFVSLSSEITKRECNADLSILDVGGGQGQLASFLPASASYCLVEPTVNGISGTSLPFPDHSFDYVVSCHVLEHIPVEDRMLFLDQLLSKSKRGVILLNPFHVEGTYVDERLKLFIEITGAEWAKEHLACSLPKVQDIRAYANENGLQCCVTPNGTLTTSMAFVFIDYFASKSELWKDWKKVNTFFNEKYTAIMDSEKYPTSYLIYLGWLEAKTNVAKKTVRRTT